MSISHSTDYLVQIQQIHKRESISNQQENLIFNMSFSGVVVLTDLDDYIAPSQACIMPGEVKKNENEGARVGFKDDFCNNM